MRSYRVTFERVGRGNRNIEKVLDATNAAELAEGIHRFVKTMLASRFFDVVVDLEEMKGSIEYGRFGRFTIEEVSS